MIEVMDVEYSYTNRYQTTHALRGVTCRFEENRFYAVTGPSGSGKTTLLSLLAGLDLPSEGSILVDGRDISDIDRDKYRREELSIVYQSLNLFPLLSAQENVAYPLELKNMPLKEAMAKAAQFIEEVGLKPDILAKRPLMMSGGEQQRVAIARALAAGGKTVLADEPTGSLDKENGRLVTALLKSLAHDRGRTVIVITHNPEVAAEADEIYALEDGRIKTEGGENTMRAIKQSLRQMLRTPLRTWLFALLDFLAVGLLATGVCVKGISDKNARLIEENFETIATVQQQADSLKTFSLYDASTKSYHYRKIPAYDSLIPLSALDMTKGTYIDPPEKRPFYAAYNERLKVFDTDMDAYIRSNVLIAEVTALESATADHSLRVSIERVIFGDSNYKKEILICDHYNPSPGALKKGVKYVVALQIGGFAHDENGERITDESGQSELSEYITLSLLPSEQYTAAGERIADEITMATPWDEVTEGFYETKRGSRWQKVGEAMYRDAYTFPVIPTQETALLMPFYDGSANLCEGRDITAEEYKNGERVCLVRREFAQRNGLSPGDSIELPLYYADYAGSPGDFYPEDDGSGAQINFVNGLLNARGEEYKAFDDGSYRIVGIYTVLGSDSFSLGRNAVVVPSSSIAGSDGDNIIAWGAMNSYSTSFRIKNGGIDSFLEQWSKKGVEGLDIQFYDRGYSGIESGLKNMQRFSVVLLAAGMAAALMVLALFAYLFLARQKQSIAVARSLGLTRARCAAVLVSGMLFIAVISSFLGSAAGFALSGRVASAAAAGGGTPFDTEYSSWTDQKDSSPDISLDTAQQSALPALFVWLGASAAAFVFAYAGSRHYLKKEPIALLENRKE